MSTQPLSGLPPQCPPLSPSLSQIEHEAPEAPEIPEEGDPLASAELLQTQPPSLPETDRTRATMLAAFLQQTTPAADPAAGFQQVGRRGLPAMRLLATAWRSPEAFLEAQQLPATPQRLEATRRLAGRALEEAANTLLQSRALERLSNTEGQLQALVAELEGPGPHPGLEQLFARIGGLELQQRSTLLRALDFQIGDGVFSNDSAPLFFNQHHSSMPENPEAARAELLSTGQTTFTGLTLTLEGIKENLIGRLSDIETARAFVEGCESPLLALRPLTRELATELPELEALHAEIQERNDGVPIEAPREDRRTDLVHAFQRTDEELAEALLLAGLIDEAQVDLAGHRAGFETTYFLASLLSPSPFSGVTSGLKRQLASPVANLLPNLDGGAASSFALRALVPAAEWTAGKAIGRVLKPLSDLPKAALRELIQGDGRFDAPLGDDPAAPFIE